MSLAGRLSTSAALGKLGARHGAQRGPKVGPVGSTFLPAATASAVLRRPAINID
jgi:hypothetical protein